MSDPVCEHAAGWCYTSRPPGTREESPPPSQMRPTFAISRGLLGSLHEGASSMATSDEYNLDRILRRGA